MNVDNLRLRDKFSTYTLPSSLSLKIKYCSVMKNWKMLVFKITLLVLIGIVILTG